MNEPTFAQVNAFAKTLKRVVNGKTYYVKAEEHPLCRMLNEKFQPTSMTFVTFCGGQSEHTILADSLERVQAHWEGYLSNNDALTPKVGQRVTVSISDRYYYAKVLKITKTRVQAQWTYPSTKHLSAPRWFKLSEISWWSK